MRTGNSAKEWAIECISMSKGGLLEQCVKNEKDFMMISTMTNKPILTHDYKQYWIIDGNCVYSFKPKP
jgi:hypothetical protein